MSTEKNQSECSKLPCAGSVCHFDESLISRILLCFLCSIRDVVTELSSTLKKMGFVQVADEVATIKLEA